MSRIRKQTRRPTKKINLPIIRNLFIQNERSEDPKDGNHNNHEGYEEILPKQILLKLSKASQLSIKNLQEFIPAPLASELNSNLSLMRNALNDQRNKISTLPIHEDIRRLDQLSNHPDEIREQTKKTSNTLNEFHPQILNLHSEDDNIFFHFDEAEARRRTSQNHEDFFQVEDKNVMGTAELMDNEEEIDIFGLISID